ncbi:MAG: YibE/F family protein [Acidimicrobiales bacterium]|nr:YibE/F family protein [Acidimicrobiales bacterium]
MDATTPLRRGLLVAVLAVGVVALAAMAVLWPRGDAPELGRQPNTYVDATVIQVDPVRCASVEVNTDTGCVQATVRITSGPDEGDQGTFLVRDIDFQLPTVEAGDKVVLLDIETSPPPYRYVFSEFQRSTPLWGLVALFAVAVIAFGRWQGVRALAGLAASALILVAFVVPAILRDEPAVLVALTGTVVIALVALYLAHGWNIATTVAVAGTLVSLAVIVVLAAAAASLTRLTGLADEQAQVLRVTADSLDLRGLLVAGIVVGALGVLDDVTVTQVSTVVALRRASPAASASQLYRDALRVGRDHVASTVNTLVLAYAGAALPLLLLFAQGSKPVGRIVAGELVAVELVRMLVGSIGLVLSVPITTALAAAVINPADTAAHGHGHRADHHHTSEHVPARWEDFAPEDGAP